MIILVYPSFVNKILLFFEFFYYIERKGGLMDNMIGQRIKERRKELHITGSQIKELTGISTGNLSDIENGKSLPSSISVIELSKALKCSTDYILLGKTRTSELDNNSDIRVEKLISCFEKMSEYDQEDLLMTAEMKANKDAKKGTVSSSTSKDNNAIA